MESEICPIRVCGDRWTASHLCGKPVKSDGLCGVHAAAKRRRDAADAEDVARRAESEDNKSNTMSALIELGIDGQPHYLSATFQYTGKVVVTLETLYELRNRRG